MSYDRPFVVTDGKIISGPAAKEMSGLVFTGNYVECQGQTFPVYEAAPKTAEKPSINTAEGWMLHRHECAEKHLLKYLHRVPTEKEIQQEMDRNAACGRRVNELVDAGASNEEIHTAVAEYYPEWA